MGTALFSKAAMAFHPNTQRGLVDCQRNGPRIPGSFNESCWHTAWHPPSTLTRVTGKQHFASDAFVGSVLGWYLGRQIYRAHHDAELGGAPWGDFIEASEKGPRNPANMGSPYVPLDSWVYPAFDRLIATGYVQSAFLGMRPWTRMQCARLLDEGTERLGSEGSESAEAHKIYQSLLANSAKKRLDLTAPRTLA